MDTAPRRLMPPNGLALALLLTAAAYIPAIGSYFQRDDWGYLLNLSRHASPWAFGDAFYRPLLLVCLGGLYKAFGLNAPAWHVAEVFVHLANVVMVYYLIQRIKLGATAAAAGSILFGIYPSNPGAVSWICALGGLNAAFFGLAAVHISLCRRLPVFARGMLSVAAFALAVLSKEDSASMIVVVGLLPLIVFEKQDRREVLKWAIACLALVAVVVGILRLEAFCHLAGGNQHGVLNLAVLRRASMFVLWMLSSMMSLARTSTVWKSAILAIVPLIMWRRWPSFRPGLLWFFGTGMGIGVAIIHLAPADRYAYIPSIGIALCFAALVDRLACRREPPTFDTWLLVGTCVLVLAKTGNELIDGILVAALLLCFWTDSTPTTARPSSCMAFVALAALLAAVGRAAPFVSGYFPDWMMSLAPLVLTGVAVGFRALKGRELRAAETALCGCLVLWCMIPDYLWLLVGMMLIEVLRSHLTTSFKLSAGWISRLAVVSRHRAIIVPGVVIALCFYGAINYNMAWLRTGRELLLGVRQSVELYERLPRGASVRISDPARFGLPEPRIHDVIAEVMAKRPDLRLVYATQDRPETNVRCDFVITYYSGMRPVLSR